MSKGQETCFACGQHVRERAHRGERPHNPLVFVFAGTLVIAAVVGIIVMISGRARGASAEAYRQERARIEESARAAVQAERDSARVITRGDATDMLVQEVNDLESRFQLVRREVVESQPSPSQARLISQIGSELSTLRQVTAAIAGQPGAPSDSLKEELRDGERLVRSLISALSRAPKR